MNLKLQHNIDYVVIYENNRKGSEWRQKYEYIQKNKRAVFKYLLLNKS